MSWWKSIHLQTYKFKNTCAQCIYISIYIWILVYYRYMYDFEHYTVQFMSEGRLMLTCKLHPLGTGWRAWGEYEHGSYWSIQQYYAFCQPQRPFLKRTFPQVKLLGKPLWETSLGKLQPISTSMNAKKKHLDHATYIQLIISQYPHLLNLQPNLFADFATTNLDGSFLGAHQSHQPGLSEVGLEIFPYIFHFQWHLRGFPSVTQSLEFLQ